MRLGFLPILAVTAATCAAGCTKPEETVKAAVATAMINNALSKNGQHVDTGKAMDAMKAMQQQAQAPKRDIVNFKQLTALLPDAPSGWTAQEPEGRTVTMGAFKISEASRHYKKGNASLTLTLSDMAQNPSAAMMAMAFSITEESSEGYRKPYSAGGVTGSEHWTKASKQGEITAVTPNQIMIQAEGNGLDGPDVVKDLFGKIDVAKVSALKP